tara:strand:- start:1749 stop:2804 length:1056 start_codon:yes stop_codon:yes gene_type:complete
MKEDIKNYLVKNTDSARFALRKITNLKGLTNLTLFVVDNKMRLVGTLTDGDIRRGLLNDLEISESVKLFMNNNFKFAIEGKIDNKLLKTYKQSGASYIPIINEQKSLKSIIDLNKTKAVLPISALIMAGGKGMRLRPLTENDPKPMLKVGDKPIIEHNIDRLISFGINEIFISVRYLKEKIIKYFGDGSKKGIVIKYIHEDEPLGTIGALSKISEIKNKDLLVINSDLLSNIDFEEFYNSFKNNNYEMSVASIPYNVSVPYAVLKLNKDIINEFVEKPKYTYYSNAGIYLIKKELKKLIPKNSFYNSTDLMNELIFSKKRLGHFPIIGYWLDIGRHDDYIQAQKDIKKINF